MPLSRHDSTYDRMKAVALVEKAEWLKPLLRPDGTTAPLYLTQNVYTDTFRETVPQADNTVDTDTTACSGKTGVKGAADKAKGAIKEAAGKVAGDKDLQTEGKLD